MVFLRWGLGFAVGCTVPFLVNEMVYMTIANSFLRPHLKFRVQMSRMDKNKAVTTEMLDAYVKDVVGSFLLFFVAIGPVVYQSYFKVKQDLEKLPKVNEIGQVDEDRYTQMLKQIKFKQVEKQMQENPGKEVDEPKITFAEYEAFLERLEKDNKLD